MSSISLPLSENQLKLIQKTHSLSKLNEILIEMNEPCNVIIYGRCGSGKTELTRILSQFIPGKMVLISKTPKEFKINHILREKTSHVFSKWSDMEISLTVCDESDDESCSKVLKLDDSKISIFTTQNIKHFIRVHRDYFDSPDNRKPTIVISTNHKQLISEIYGFDEDFVELFTSPKYLQFQNSL